MKHCRRKHCSDRSVAIIARGGVDRAQEVAQRIGLQHKLVRTDEMDNPNYVTNLPTAAILQIRTFRELNPLAAELGFKHVVYVLCSMIEATTPGAQAARDYQYGPRWMKLTSEGRDS